MEQERGTSVASDATYAFLNHSTTTLVNKLPPDVDNKPLARQKRKRTSPEDQAVLEAAYSRDPKPDKEARLKLVEQIALGEKEVQIWFQNRRQTSRRKSRPLMPHEIAHYQMARYGPLKAEDTDSDGSDPHNSSLEQDDARNDQPSVSLPSSDDTFASPSAAQHDHQVAVPETGAESIQSEVIEAQRTLPSTASSQGYVANRRSLPSLSQVLESLDNSRSSPPETAPTRGIRKSTSFVRLSMTSEGAAKVVTKEGLSPSPPRPSQHNIAEVGAREASPSRQSYERRTSSGLKRSVSGRSRDSRAWEFWCDKDCRSELEDKAEKDGKGSAADAIGMMRAANNRRALQPLAARHNTGILRHQPRSTAHKTQRPSLQRAHTSGGRLQYAVPGGHIGQAKRKRLLKADSSVEIYIPGNESDKENWSPGESSYAGKHDANKSQYAHHDGKADGENVAPEDDLEVAAFMKPGRSSSRSHAVEELDCVQGLLSLSQGNWTR